MASPARLGWRRYRRNRLAVGSLAFVVVTLALCFPGAPLLARAFGHGPDDPFPYAVSLAGGWADSLVGRASEFVMAFPLLLLLIMVGSTSLGDALDGVSYGTLVPRGVVSLVLVIGLFTWFYPARVVRTQVLSLRERE